jgi:Protein of unknown function (DUF2845)
LGPDARLSYAEGIPAARRENGTTYQVGTTIIEHWTYRRGPGRFTAEITVEGGKARKIELVRD